MKTLLDPARWISFNRPFVAGQELYYIAQAVMGGHLAGDGKFTKLCQEWLEDHFGARKVVLTHSCTGALEIAAMVCGIEPGDEVILPSFTFASTANAFVLRGARPVFVDIRPDTLNLDEAQVEAAISARTKVIVPVHYAGVSCNMDPILEVARRHGLRVVEDAAQAVDAKYGDRYLGTLGDLGCWSFHETKNFISGEGGALVVNDPELIERVEVIREKGTNRSKFLRGQVDKYTWVDIGSSYAPSELMAAFLYGQLEESQQITSRRTAIFQRYQRGLGDLEEEGLLRLPIIPEGCHHNAHMFYLLLPNAEQRDGLIRALREADISAVFHYVPLHSSPMGKRLLEAEVELPVTEDVSGRLVRLPCYYDLTEAQQERVIDNVRRFVRRAGEPRP